MMDIQKKQEELTLLWSDLFDVCRALVDQMKAGKVELKAGLLQQLNSFLKESGRVLENLNEIQRRQLLETRYSVQDNVQEETSGDEVNVPFPLKEPFDVN